MCSVFLLFVFFFVCFGGDSMNEMEFSCCFFCCCSLGFTYQTHKILIKEQTICLRETKKQKKTDLNIIRKI